MYIYIFASSVTFSFLLIDWFTSGASSSSFFFIPFPFLSVFFSFLREKMRERENGALPFGRSPLRFVAGRNDDLGRRRGGKWWPISVTWWGINNGVNWPVATPANIYLCTYLYTYIYLTKVGFFTPIVTSFDKN